MKNVHILRTDKPRKLADVEGLLVFGKDLKSPVGHPTMYLYQHIYITSDEEIKEGDWVYTPNKTIMLVTAKYATESSFMIGNSNHEKSPYYIEFCKKIILTTDQDLIKDGVQAIDDDFLEWFVKNPSCEFVEVSYGVLKPFQSIDKGYMIHLPDNEVLEEPKQIYYNTVGRENGVNVVKGQFNTQKEALDLANELNRKFPDLYYDWRETLIKEEPKQETLEEVRKVERTELFNSIFSVVKQIPRKDVDGDAMDAPSCAYEIEQLFYKYQQEKRYSEEEVKSLLHKFMQSEKPNWHSYSTQKWFEQFKKNQDE
jgi:hypothetical protein